MKKNLNVRLIGFLLIVSAAMLSNGCYPGGATYVDELDLAGTVYDDEWFGRKAPSTYYMPDTVIHLIDDNNNSNNIEIPRETDELILKTIADNMANNNYTRLDTIDDSNRPDVILLAEAMAVKNTSVIYYPGYPWWGYWGWNGWPGYGWGPGWGWGYPGGYIPVVSSYSTGSVFVNMMDPAESDFDNKEHKLVWIGAVNGMLSSSTSNNESRVKSGIDQLFTQSPYLKNN